MNQMTSTGPAPVVSQPIADPLADRPSIVAEEPVLNGDREPLPGVTPEDGPAKPEAAPAEPPPDPEAEERRKGARERIAQLTALHRQEQALNASLRAELARLRQPITNVDRDQLSPEQEAALSVREAVRAESAAQTEARAQAQAIQSAQIRTAIWEAKVEAARDRFPDMDQAMAVFDSLPITEVEADIIAESDKAAELTYYLGKNPHEALALQRMPVHMRAAHLARLEAKVSVPPKRTSTAPPPVPTVTGATAPGGFDPNAASAADYSAWYKQQYGRR